MRRDSGFFMHVRKQVKWLLATISYKTICLKELIKDGLFQGTVIVTGNRLHFSNPSKYFQQHKKFVILIS